MLIHLPPPGKGNEGKRGTWVAPSECFWRGEPWLTQSVGLEKRYSDLETLFRTHLQIPNAGLDHYIREATAISHVPSPLAPPIEKLIGTIATYVRLQGVSGAQKATLQELNILPISPGRGEPEYLTSVNSKKLWLIADRENFRTQFQDVLPLLAFKADFILKIKPLLRVLGLQDRFLSDLATSVTEAHGETKLHNKLTLKYRDRSKYLFRLTPENQADVKHLRAKFRNVDVYLAPKIIQYWQAPLGLRNVSSTPHDGAAFLEADYAGDLRIYLRDDAEKDTYPYELAEQLRNFFNIPDKDRDLLAAAMTAPEDRVEQLFESRGIPPLLEDGGNEEDEGEEGAAYSPVQFPPPPSKKKASRLGGDSRVSRLLSSTRFGPSFFKQDEEKPAPVPPTYSVAVARSTQNAMGRPVEPRTFASAITLPTLKSAINDLEFVQTQGAVVGTPRSAPTMLDRFRRLVQHDDEVGERMVSDILAAVLGPQYDKSSMWKSRADRKGDPAAFNFSDTQGRFSAFLMRLEGLPGKAQGYTRLIYHLLVKTTDGETFKITQEELTRAREYSVHSQPDPAKQAPSKHVSVLVHISDTRSEPKIRFLADPWDLFEDRQLILENSRAYQARLALRLRQPGAGPGRGESGFDSIQIRQRADGDEDEDEDGPAGADEPGTRPEKGKKKWKGKGKMGAEEPSPAYEEKKVHFDETRPQVGEV
ncbi:uncharacterized protein DNG_01496 [Cephalotrichum gorgonifer]|uniref:Uncharacterized protein n=1 Tax=Cephalotrichum gorgonifer TaxID=2041049 RepID=A0AAE8MRA5_9PEZI|nr:uncharacterized protein DNG_01496 [Cephalotrichum gorgonifer]